MPEQKQISELKEQIKTAIRRNSDRGFLSYNGCNRVCGEMMFVLEAAESAAKDGNIIQAFDIYIVVLLEVMKMISHADTSSGAAGDIVHNCLDEIDKLCKGADEASRSYLFNATIKASGNKAFKDWAENGYTLLKCAAGFVRDRKQAQKIYDVFSMLGNTYDGNDYSDKLLITHQIIEILEGMEAADKYIMDNIEVPEIRRIAIENAMTARNYSYAENLCLEALEKDPRRYINNKTEPWAYYLEQIYTETADGDKLTEIIQYILLHGDTSYYKKLKELYQQKGIWDQEKQPLLEKLSKAYLYHLYAIFLAQEGEVQKLLDVIRQHNFYVTEYGKLLAGSFPEETYNIYEEYILEEAKDASDRGKYKKVCYIIKSLSEAGANIKAIEMINRLSEMYPRRPAMLDELAGLKRKLGK